MAVTCTNLTQFTSDTDATSYATASITPTANRLLIATVTSSKGTTPDTPTLSGNSLTWVQIDTNNFDAAGTQRTMTMFRAMGASPTAGAVTASFAGTQTACTIIIDEFTGMDTTGTDGSGAIVQSAKNAEASQAAATFTVTLATFLSTNNATYGAASNGDTAFSAGTGFTSVGTSATTTPVITSISEFRNDNDTTVTFGGSIGFTSGGIAVEIKARTDLLVRSASSNSSTTGTAISVSAPAGATTGDLMKVVVQANGQTTIAENNFKTITATNLVASSNVTSGTSFATSSQTFTAGKFYLFGFNVRDGSSTNPSLPTVTGASITWSSVGSTSNFDDSGTSRRVLFLFSGYCSSTTSGALTADFGAVSHTGMIYTIDELSYADSSGTIVQSASNRDTSGTASTLVVTLAAFTKTSNATYAVFCNGTSALTTTAGTGFTKLGDVSESNANVSGRLTSEFRNDNDTSADITYSSTSQLGGIAVEIKSATATFTEQVDDYKPNTVEGHTVSIFSRVVEAGDPTTYNFTSGASDRWGVVAICFAGTSTPQDDVAPSTANAANRDSFPDGDSTSASITTGVDRALHIVAHCWDTSAIAAITTPTGYTLIANANGGGEPVHTSYKEISVAGATGTTTATIADLSSYIAFSFSIKAPQASTEQPAIFFGCNF